MQWWQLIIHERIHTGEKPYHRIICGEGITSRSNLIVHERIHTEQKPYHCSTCGKGFAQSIHMTSHERTRCQLYYDHKCENGLMFSIENVIDI